MLAELDLKRKLAKAEYGRLKPDLDVTLGTLQRAAREAGVPVLILFEGWGAAGKGTLVNELILPLDPRGFDVHALGRPDKEERRRPFLCRYWPFTPARGRIAVLCRSWYRRLLEDRLDGDVDEAGAAAAVADIRACERHLAADGVVIVKFFLHVSQKEQRRRLERLEADRATAWRVTRHDWRQQRHYEEFRALAEAMIAATDAPHAPWTAVAAHQRRHAVVQVFQTVSAALRRRLDARGAAPVTPSRGALVGVRRHPAGSILRRIDQRHRVTRAAYERKLQALQEELRELQFRAWRRHVATAVAFEGWDAAGKGGAIRRLVQRLDPRGYDVVPVAAPDATELAHHYLWRFWRRLPAPGHLTVFDRTWYGRVLVERVEGLCAAAAWRRAYAEINDMERHLCAHGLVLVKFWMQIDRAEQLRRFRERERVEWKRWKITPEDWRNRRQWPRYEVAVEEMLRQTDTEWAPWTIVPANDKLHARLEVLETVAAVLRTRLDDA